MAKPQLKEVSVDLVDDPASPARSSANMGDLESLAQSIAQMGVIEPIVVAARNGRYEVVAGHRRLLASKMAGLVTVPCVIHTSFKAAEEAVMLHENIHREELNPVDEARFFEKLLVRVDGDTERLAALVRERREYVESRLILLSGDIDVLAALETGQITIGVAHELNQYKHRPTMISQMQAAIAGGATTAVVRAWRKQQNTFYDLQQTRVEPTGDVAPAEPPREPENPYVCLYCRTHDHIEMMRQYYVHVPCMTMLLAALGLREKE